MRVPLSFPALAAPAGPSACEAPFGRSVEHDGTVVAYREDLVPVGESCASEIRSCQNGVLSGSFEHGSCTTYIPTEAEKEQWFREGLQTIQSHIRAGGYNARNVRVAERAANPPRGFTSSGSTLYSPWGERIWFQSGGPTIDGVRRISFRINIDDMASPRCHIVLPVTNGSGALGSKMVQFMGYNDLFTGSGSRGALIEQATTATNFATITSSQANAFCSSGPIRFYAFMEY